MPICCGLIKSKCRVNCRIPAPSICTWIRRKLPQCVSSGYWCWVAHNLKRSAMCHNSIKADNRALGQKCWELSSLQIGGASGHGGVKLSVCTNWIWPCRKGAHRNEIMIYADAVGVAGCLNKTKKPGRWRCQRSHTLVKVNPLSLLLNWLIALRYHYA